MTISLTITIILAVIAAMCAAAAWLGLRRWKSTVSELKNAEERLRVSEEARVRAEERVKVVEELTRQNEGRMKESFAAIAAESLQRNSGLLTEQSRMQLAELIAPMKTNLDDFRRAYTDAYGKESEKRAMLEQQLNELFRLNHNISEETRRLGEALKGNSGVQGQWGEMVLENILERSGLQSGQDYYVQKTVDAADSKARPDVVIACPGGRNIVVDSKVSLTDYMRMLNAPDRKAAKAAGEAHLASVRKHVAELRRKSYQDLLSGRNADFVMMFVPHEGAYLAAMQLDNELWQTAFDSRVIIVSPTHLVSVVRLVEMMWRQDKQNRNAVEIADLGSKMLDKLSNFLNDMAKVSAGLDSARKAYDAAMTKLEGRGGIRSIGENMRDKGVKASRDLPPRQTPDYDS